MTWSFTIPGQPPSVNHSYRPVRMYRADGSVRMGIAKVPGLEAWQTSVALIVRSARPSGWQPQPLIKLSYEFFYRRRFDADNALKALNDAIAHALDVNDHR